MLFEIGLPIANISRKWMCGWTWLSARTRRRPARTRGRPDTGVCGLVDGLEADIVWGYETPIPEIPKIAGRLLLR
jgi:hypothetical protein